MIAPTNPETVSENVNPLDKAVKSEIISERRAKTIPAVHTHRQPLKHPNLT